MFFRPVINVWLQPPGIRFFLCLPAKMQQQKEKRCGGDQPELIKGKAAPEFGVENESAKKTIEDEISISFLRYDPAHKVRQREKYNHIMVGPGHRRNEEAGHQDDRDSKVKMISQQRFFGHQEKEKETNKQYRS